MDTEEVLYNLSKSVENVFTIITSNPFVFNPFLFEPYMSGASVLIRLVIRNLVGHQITESQLVAAIDKALEEIKQRGASDFEMEGATMTAMHSFSENDMVHEAQKRHKDLESLGIDVGMRLV